MNKLGELYIQKINNEWKDVLIEYKRSFSNEVIYERLMRLGIESKVYELKDDDEHRLMALTTLKEDITKKFRKIK